MMNFSSFLSVFLIGLLLPISTAIPVRTQRVLEAGLSHDIQGDIELEVAIKLKLNFYRKSCPLVENIVRNITWSHVKTNRTLAAKLLRLHYHDCFVRGCDASILLDPVEDETVEKDAGPNRSISGYEIIDEIKATLEEKCSGKVSCADILALAARDAVSYQFGRPMWKVFLGRRDGNVSRASEASSQLPGGGSNFTTLKEQFSDNGLDVTDLVALSGAHTIRVAHCVVISRRLFNFTGKGDTDPSIDTDYAKELKEKCANTPNNNPANTTIDLDRGSSLTFDSHYFTALGEHQGLLQSDAALLTDPTSASYVKEFQKFHYFMDQFGKSMNNMGRIGVLTRENEGSIRQNCRRIN